MTHPTPSDAMKEALEIAAGIFREDFKRYSARMTSATDGQAKHDYRVKYQERLGIAEKCEKALQAALAHQHDGGEVVGCPLCPDWVVWEKDLHKAAVGNSEPATDEELMRFRHALADVHCKSTSAERDDVEYRLQRFGAKMWRKILARLDRAEADTTAWNANMDEAPRDGTFVDLGFLSDAGFSRTVDCWWEGCRWIDPIGDYGDPGDAGAPTHWQHLPQPPKEQG